MLEARSHLRYAQVKVGMLRLFFFLCVFFFNLMLTYVDVEPQYKLDIRNNIRSDRISALCPSAAPISDDRVTQDDPESGRV